MESGEGGAPDGGRQPAPGWYPDPVDSEGLRYWDGKRWTFQQAPKGDRPPAPGVAPAKAPAELKPLGSTGRLAIAAVVITALVNAGYLVIALGYSDNIDATLNGDPPAMTDADDVSDAFEGVSGGNGLAMLVSAVFFLIWFHRGYRNAEGLTRSRLRFGTGWAVGAWFVPFLNLWRPKQIANDVWRAGDPKARENPAWNSLPVAGFVHWWWALWLLAGAVSSIGGLMLSTDPVLTDFISGSSDVTRSDLEMERTAATILAASAAFEVIAAAAAVMFIRQAGNRQDELISGGSG